MLLTSAKMYKAAVLGDTVIIPVPKVDRARTDFPNLTGKIIRIEDNEFYEIATAVGLLNQLFTRN